MLDIAVITPRLDFLQVTQRFREVLSQELPSPAFRKGDDQDDGGLEWVSSATAGDDWRDRTAESETMKGYITLSAAGTKTNHLDAKTRELIALAVAVTLRCDGCITVHTEAAIKHNASREEIAEALGMAVAVNAGAALVYSARAMDAYEANPAAAALAKK
jgi:AhpD family alkylhydroperoxidase